MTNLPATILPAIQPFVEGAVEEIEATIVECEFERRQLYLRMWWMIGGIILDWQRAAEEEMGETVPLRPFVCNVLQKVGRSVESGYKAVQFRQRFPDEASLEGLPFGKAASWHLVVNKVLPGLGTGKTIQEIAQEDAQEMRQSQAAQPRLLYDGPARLDVDVDDGWIVELPDRTQLKAWPGQEIWVKIWEQQ